MRTYDLAYSDLNPQIMYASKTNVSHSGVYHSHSHLELTIVLSGKIRYLVNGQYYNLVSGDILVCNPGVMHQSILIDSEKPIVEFYTGFSGFHFIDNPPDHINLEDNSCLMHTDGELRQWLQKVKKTNRVSILC